MKTVVYNGNWLEMYDSIDEMPIVRFQHYNRYVLIDAGIGSDLASVDAHLATLQRFIARGDRENADKEIMNLRTNLNLVISATSPRQRAFVMLIKTMNGRRLEDVSDEAVERVIGELAKGGLTMGKMLGFLDQVKKKLTKNWKPFSRAGRTTPKQRNITAA